MSLSIFRRLICGKIASSPILRRRKFCTAAPPPCLMLPHHFMGERDMVYNFYSPANNKVVSFNNRGGEEETRLMQDDKTKVVGSSHGWLALYNSRNRGMFLSNPVSGRLIDLPPLAGRPFSGEAMPHKLVMSCPPEEEECRAVLIYGDSAEHVAFCCPGLQGRGSSQWAPLESGRRYRHDSHSRMFPDFVYSAARKRFMALVYYAPPQYWHCDDEIEVEYWDISEPSCPRMDGVEGPWETWSRGMNPVFSYIVCVGAGPGADQLFLVTQPMHKILLDLFDFKNNDAAAEHHKFFYFVSEIKDGGGLELCSSSLDDLAMFVGLNHSIVSPSPKLKGNCIYYADPRGLNFYKGQYIGTFDYQKKTCSPIYFPKSKHYQETDCPMVWITPTFD